MLSWECLQKMLPKHCSNDWWGGIQISDTWAQEKLEIKVSKDREENAREFIPSQNQDPRSKICTEVLWKILDLGFARTSLSLYQSKILATSLVRILDLGSWFCTYILNAFLPKLFNMPEFRISRQTSYVTYLHIPAQGLQK